jgi:hypothetical protein
MTTRFYMNLQESDDFAEADCGCILQRGTVPGVEAELLICPLHDAAEVLFDAAKVAADQLFDADMYLDPETGSVYLDYLILRAAISKAGGGKDEKNNLQVP